MSTPRDDARPLDGRRVLLGVSGGIAAYKSAALASKLVQQGAEVRVVMTEAATRFVTPLTFQALSGRSVITSIWQHDDRPDSQHVGLARWCELMVIAPATADLIGKLAAGLCDDPVSLAATALPHRSETSGAGGGDDAGVGTPLLLAPAMNADMWQSPIVQRNLATLRELLGVRTIGPDAGWQACRTAGPGRMAEPDAIADAAADALR